MKHIKYLVLGAGPCGLSIAHQLRNMGEDSFLVLEKEAEAGGLCRSRTVDGHPLDIGGGHFLDVRRQEVLDFLFHFMPREEWTEHQRVAKIRLRGIDVGHPLEANLWQFPTADQVDYLEAISQAGCVRGTPMPVSFMEWISWKLGAKIAGEYMLPYNRKLWCMDLNRLGTYWLYKLPDVSFRDALRSCLEGKSFGKLPAHGIFLYPKRNGYGEVWRRMGLGLGERLMTGCPVTSLDTEKRLVNGVFSAGRIITTIPWTTWPDFCAIPADVLAAIRRLVHISVDVDYFPHDFPTPAHWIYEPDEALSYHRILVRKNFCPGSRGYWTEANALRSPIANRWRHHNEFAYPVNTSDKPDAVTLVAAWARSHGIVATGRWGTWEHMNSDVAVAEGIHTAKQVIEECRSA